MAKRKFKRLVFDVPNMLFRVAAQRATNPQASADDLAGISMHMALLSVNKYFKMVKPDEVVFGFEARNNWRKIYTEDEATRTVPLKYKGNRVPDPNMMHFYELIQSFKDACDQHTSVICLSVEGCECDDIIAGYCQMYGTKEEPTDDDCEISIVSGDKDFIQLLKFRNVTLINPDTGKPRNQPGDKIYFEDLDYFIFQKCIRGDMGDYVHSAYPRVRETRIKKAYDDPFERVNLMNDTWDVKDEEGNVIKTWRVGDLYEENKKLMDLECQPLEIREYLLESIREGIKNCGKYSNFQMIKFLGKYRLNSINESLESFVPLFTANTKTNRAIEQALLEPAPQKQPTLLEY